MNDGPWADRAAEWDGELVQAESSPSEQAEQKRRVKPMFGLTPGLGDFEGMRAHEVHLLAARLSPGRG